MADDIQFERAEFEGQASAGTCVACGQPVRGEYYSANGKVCCPACKEQIATPPHPRGKLARLAKAVVLGTLGGLLGAAVWWAVARFANLEIGIIAILVGFLVGGGVRIGAERVGGRGYQVLAVLLTYLSVAVAYTPFVYTGLTENGEANEMPAVAIAIIAYVLALAVPFMQGFENIIGIIIIAIALWEAWRMNARPKIEWSGPHRVAADPVIEEPAPAAAMPPPLPPSG